MANFSAQITEIIGSAGTNTLDYFNQGLIDATQRLLIVNPSIIPKLETETITEDNNTVGGDANVNDGISIENQGMLISVARNDKVLNTGTSETPAYDVGKRIANQINPNDRFLAEDTSSLKRATACYPKYYMLNGKVFILPQLTHRGGAGNEVRDEGIVTYIKIPKVTGNLNITSITGFPEEYYRAPILYACIKVLQELIHTDTDTLNTLIVTDEDPELAVLQQQKIDGRLKQQQLLQAEYEQIFMPYQMPSKEENQEGARQ